MAGGGTETPPAGPYPTPAFDAITKLGTNVYEPTAVAGLPVVLKLHGSGGGLATQTDGDRYQATLTAGNTYSTDTTFKWCAAQYGGVLNLVPADRAVRADSNVIEAYWMGYTHDGTGAPNKLDLLMERRLTSMLAWARNTHPTAAWARACATGGSMGAFGCMTYALRRPDVFAAIYPDRPRVRHNLTAGQITIPDWESISIAHSAGAAPDITVADGGGNAFTRLLDHIAYVANTANPIPWVGWCIGWQDPNTSRADHVAFVQAMRTAERGFAFAWNNGDHVAGSIISQITDSYPYGTFEVGKGYPLFTEHSLDSDPATALVGGINVGLKFRNVTESAGSWSCQITHISAACTVKVKPKSTVYTGTPASQLVNITAANTWVTVSF